MLYKLLAAICILFTTLFAQSNTPIKFVNDQEKVVYLTYNSQFDKAVELVNSYLKKDPNSLEWNYFNAMIKLRKLSFYAAYNEGFTFTEAEKEKFYNENIEELERVGKIGEELIKKNPADTLAIFYTGAVYGFIGMYQASNNSYLKAVSSGKKGLNYHDELVEKCPRWNDVYYSKAIFNFFASNVPWLIKPFMWIFGYSGTEYRAEFYLQKVVKWGNLAKYDAKEYLVKLYNRQEKYAEANKILEELANELPNSKYKYASQLNWNEDQKEWLMKYWKKYIQDSKKEDLDDSQKSQVFNLYSQVVYRLTGNQAEYQKIELFNELLERNLVPKYINWCLYNLAENHLLVGKKEEALKNYHLIIKNGNGDYKIKAEEKIKN